MYIIYIAWLVSVGCFQSTQVHEQIEKNGYSNEVKVTMVKYSEISQFSIALNNILKTGLSIYMHMYILVSCLEHLKIQQKSIAKTHNCDLGGTS